VQDFGNTLGANGASIHYPIYGQAYLVDPRYMMISGLSLGMYVRPWDEIDAQDYIPHPSVGYFRSETFRPGQWVSVHPIPAFENMTLRDAFWGAKQVMSFSDEDIIAIVKSGQLSNKNAEEYLTQTLIERRDMIGDYWFRKINPIDKFMAERHADQVTLAFTDLGTEKGIFNSNSTRYVYTLKLSDGTSLATTVTSERPSFTNSVAGPQPGETLILHYEIRTIRDGVNTSEKKADVYVVEDDNGIRIGGIKRHE